MTTSTLPRRTALFESHKRLGGKIVDFHGWELPVQYESIMKEHAAVRNNCGLFDVSHMGQGRLRGVAPLAAFEEVVPGDFIGLKPGRQKYSMLLNRTGGIIDDLMASRPDDDGLFVVVNGACKENDFAVIADELGPQVTIERYEDRALIALQGPEAAAALAVHAPEVAQMVFMDIRWIKAFGEDLIVSRSGYTGEDGFEISIPGHAAVAVFDALLADERVKPIGLGARDSLRLEAGLPLYGHDLDETVSPVEAGLTFAVNKNRREQRDFPGAARIVKELAEGPARKCVALKVLEGAPAREGAEISDETGAVIGIVTSGGYSPVLKCGIAIGFAPPAAIEVGGKLNVIVRGKTQACEVVKLPFVPHRYVRKVGG